MTTATACDLQQQIATHGIASCQEVAGRPVDGLPGYAEMFQESGAFIRGPRVLEAWEQYQQGRRYADFKAFLVKYRDTEQWTATDPIIRFALNEEILELVARALGRPARLQSADYWCVLPSAFMPPVLSQFWHRDPEDRHMLKMFLYLLPVDDDCGPFQYVLESHERDFEECPAGSYWNPAHLERFPYDRVRTFTGPAGTLLFAHTSGLHRGGYGVKPRLNAAWTFTTTDRIRRKFQVPEPPANASPLALHALGFN